MIQWWYYAVVIVALIVTAIYATLYTLEDSFLLHPAPTKEYIAFNQSQIKETRLPAGGLVLHLLDDDVDPKGRAIMCLHGNAGNLDGMANTAYTLSNRGYDVYLLEYAGYGKCAYFNQKRLKPTKNSLVTDLHQGWEIIPEKKRRSAILLGFSMGGGTICQFLSTAKTNDLPAQVALMNTYYDLPLLVKDVFPIPGIPELMHTQWNAKNGLNRYRVFTKDRSDGPGNILIVAAADDQLIPIKHAHLLIQSIQDSYTRRELVILPDGGHNSSIERHFNLWLNALVHSHPFIHLTPKQIHLEPSHQL